ncbi:MAG: hypothetical protein NT136_01175 [Candidatus Moranbacteria bacterium]|nr:hypothetical protein [Candidatus Moranbacteria bacterium]
MEKKQMQKEIKEIIKRNGAFPALVVLTKKGLLILGELQALYSDRLALRKFNTPPEQAEGWTFITHSAVEKIKHVPQIELINMINNLESCCLVW